MLQNTEIKLFEEQRIELSTICRRLNISLTTNQYTNLKHKHYGIKRKNPRTCRNTTLLLTQKFTPIQTPFPNN